MHARKNAECSIARRDAEVPNGDEPCREESTNKYR